MIVKEKQFPTATDLNIHTGEETENSHGLLPNIGFELRTAELIPKLSRHSQSGVK